MSMTYEDAHGGAVTYEDAHGDRMTMTYEDQVAIGNNLNAGIARALHSRLGPEYDPELIGEIAQAVLVQLDQAGYKIERK